MSTMEAGGEEGENGEKAYPQRWARDGCRRRASVGRIVCDYVSGQEEDAMRLGMRCEWMDGEVKGGIYVWVFEVKGRKICQDSRNRFRDILVLGGTQVCFFNLLIQLPVARFSDITVKFFGV